MNRTLIAGALAAFALLTPAFAQDPMMMKDNMGMTMGANGEMMMMAQPMTADMMAMAMKSATAVPDGTIFFMSGGKLMMMQDMKMENGMMMSDEMMKK